MKTITIIGLLVFTFCALSVTCENAATKIFRRSLFLRRRKRYLTFPKGSNLTVSLAAVKALLRLQPTGWNILGEVDFPFALPSDAQWITQAIKPLKRRTKREIYSVIEAGLTRTGVNGTACVQRMMCDAQKYIPLKGKSLIKDILLAIFSKDEETFLSEETCKPELFVECSVSILDYIFKGYITPVTLDAEM